MYLVDKEKLNRSFSSKIVEARVAQIFNSFDRILVTSSFGTTSAVLLHIINRVRPNHPIYFIDTRYHFKQTISYKVQLTRLYSLNVIDLLPDKKAHQQTRDNRMWSNEPDRCCEINKVKPLSKIKSDFDIWVSGLIGYQNRYRSKLKIIDIDSGMLKCYPLIDWSRDLVNEYMEFHGIPRHPLEKEGYQSIGCTHCTRCGENRSGRWSDISKSECGLHG
ncbi:MAG: phosphoadenylyl-sulfate reductase [Balneolaceae bacterium]|nr:phosphoadenylyl-sulfate reductase [Balneolaceae bacterium]